MTKAQWMGRLNDASLDLEVAMSSRCRSKNADCEALRQYIAWIRLKISRIIP